MAKQTTKKRARRAAKRLEQQARGAMAERSALRPQSGRRFPEPPGWRDDLDGGAGVREPRRPAPSMPAGALELDLPSGSDLRLDLVSR